MKPFDRACTAFDQLNSTDPVREVVNGVARPRTLVHADRLSDWVSRLDPNASEPLRLAARCQHLERWRIPRTELPPGRVGYLRWRTELSRFHAERAEAVLRDSGYQDPTVFLVRAIITKQNLRSNPDVQTMEDALCLVFLEYEWEPFLDKHPDQGKAVEILRKTWKKMSGEGRRFALELEFSERTRKLMQLALSADDN